jgi:osmotically-inducible protein OsmY
VSNLITIKPKLAPVDISIAIKAAFERNAQLEADSIEVDTLGNNVILRGKVGNYAEREEAERVAWAAPGVYSVDNQLTYSWTSDYAE